MMRRPKNSPQDLIGNGVSKELAADVATVEDAFVDCGLFFRRERRISVARHRFHDVPFHEKSRSRPSATAAPMLPAGLLTEAHPVQTPSRHKASGIRPDGPHHSVGHVADFHRLPDYPATRAPRAPEAISACYTKRRLRPTARGAGSWISLPIGSEAMRPKTKIRRRSLIIPGNALVLGARVAIFFRPQFLGPACAAPGRPSPARSLASAALGQRPSAKATVRKCHAGGKPGSYEPILTLVLLPLSAMYAAT